MTDPGSIGSGSIGSGSIGSGSPAPRFSLSPVRTISTGEITHPVRLLICPALFNPALADPFGGPGYRRIGYLLDARCGVVAFNRKQFDAQAHERLSPIAWSKDFSLPARRMMEALILERSDSGAIPSRDLKDIYYSNVIGGGRRSQSGGQIAYFVSRRFTEEFAGMSAHRRTARLRSGWRFSETWPITSSTSWPITSWPMNAHESGRT